jgi:hypothetical protein
MSVASPRKKGGECGVRMRRLSKNHLFAVGPVQLAIPDGVSRNLGRPLAPDSCRASIPRISIQILRTSAVGTVSAHRPRPFCRPVTPSLAPSTGKYLDLAIKSDVCRMAVLFGGGLRRNRPDTFRSVRAMTELAAQSATTMTIKNIRVIGLTQSADLLGSPCRGSARCRTSPWLLRQAT